MDVELDSLPDDDLFALVEQMEAVHYLSMREDIITFASNTETPGAPRPLTEAEKRVIAARKRGEDVLEGGRDKDIPDEDDKDFYPQMLEVPAHGELLLRASVKMLKGQKFKGRINGKGPEVEVEVDGIMNFLPPGSAKSTYTSVILPSYLLGYFKGFDIICASYAAELAKRFGRRVRHIVRNKGFEKTFDAAITEDNQAVDQWSLTNGSSYRAVGVLGGVTGFRADCLVLDDIVAGREEADSEVIREKTYAALMDDLFSRLKPEFGKIILNMTRWHEDDPAGRLLGQHWKGQSGLWRGTDGRIWYVFCIPMIAEHADDPLGRKPGERLWAERFTEKFVNVYKNGNQRTWSALYQQRPSSAEGNILLRTLWRCWPHGRPEPTDAQIADPQSVAPPEDLEMIILSYDTAFEEGEENDFSAMTAWGTFQHKSTTERLQQKDQGNVIMIGAWQEQIQAAELIEMVEHHVSYFKRWRIPIVILVEKKASGIQLIQEIRRRRTAPVIGWTKQGVAGTRGKIPRAYAAQVIMDQGTVWYMPGPRTEAVRAQCAALPNGKNDDMADTVTQLLIFVRDGGLLEIPTDLEDIKEEEEREEREYRDSTENRLGYGRVNTGKKWAGGRLYGR